MTQSNASLLTQLLQQEINYIEQLVKLLSEEKQALIGRQFENLEGIAVQKQTISGELEQCTNQRIQLLGIDPQHKQPKEALNSFLAECTKQEGEQISMLNQKLMEALVVCRELNAVNGQVITSNINTRQEILNELTGQSPQDPTSVYTSTGNIKSSGDSSTTNHQKA